MWRFTCGVCSRQSKEKKQGNLQNEVEFVLTSVRTLMLESQAWLFKTFYWSTTKWFGYIYAYSRRRQWHPTPVLLPRKSHRWRSLAGCSPWGREESDTTEQLHFPFSLSCIGEGNGNPLQCSCLENPRDDGAWWAAVYGVAQSQTWLKWLSSSSSIHILLHVLFYYGLVTVLTTQPCAIHQEIVVYQG